MCVRRVDVRFVLRFTFLLAVRLGLPRPASRVIHRSELCTESAVPRYPESFKPIPLPLFCTSAEDQFQPHLWGPRCLVRTAGAFQPVSKRSTCTRTHHAHGGRGASRVYERSHRSYAPTSADSSRRRPRSGGSQGETLVGANRPVSRTSYKLRPSKRFRLRTTANDPSAGSPTDTLLRLLLPLSGRARLSFLTTRLETQGIEANADESEGLARSFNR